MFRVLIIISIALIQIPGIAQINGLPKWMTEEEKRLLEENGPQYFSSRGIEEAPPFENLRNMAEWEEIQALTIAWTSYPGILKQIVKHAKQETLVIILTEDAQETEDYLTGSAGGFSLTMENIVLLDGEYDSIWMRDYAGNSVYGNEVDSLIMVDWIYNRPNRPNDDASPALIAEYLALDLYCMTEAPADLVNTGGNYMSDGFGTAFASELILEENELGNPYGVTVKDESQIDDLLQEFLGVDTYIKMDALLYDNINHIDMHLKLIDESTLLVGEFPEGFSDGPQINANIEYVINNFSTKWGTPFDVVYIPMPDDGFGGYPNGNWNGPSYRTYTNSVFVNNTLLFPTYREEYDTIAYRIYEENLPGYNVVGIDCDNSPEAIINASGAIHCITHSVGVEDPLLISHLPLSNTYDDMNDYTVDSYMNHRAGVEEGYLYWKTDIDGGYQMVSMSPQDNNIWSADIPAQEVGTIIYYYVEGVATDGKVQTRPMPAPDAYWKFKVLDESVVVEELDYASFQPVFPNPAGAITCIPVHIKKAGRTSISLHDVTGRIVENIYEGNLTMGEHKFFFDASIYSAGAYILKLEIEGRSYTQNVMIK